MAPRLDVRPSTLRINETSDRSRGFGIIFVRLTEIPRSNVSVELRLSNQSDGFSGSPGRMEFAPRTWNTRQTARIDVTNDDIYKRRTARVVLRATGEGVSDTKTVRIVVIDDEDPPDVEISDFRIDSFRTPMFDNETQILDVDARGDWDEIDYRWTVSAGSVDDATNDLVRFTPPKVTADTTVNFTVTATARGTGDDYKSGAREIDTVQFSIVVKPAPVIFTARFQGHVGGETELRVSEVTEFAATFQGHVSGATELHIEAPVIDIATPEGVTYSESAAIQLSAGNYNALFSDDTYLYAVESRTGSTPIGRAYRISDGLRVAAADKDLVRLRGHTIYGATFTNSEIFTYSRLTATSRRFGRFRFSDLAFLSQFDVNIGSDIAFANLAAFGGFIYFADSSARWVYRYNNQFSLQVQGSFRISEGEYHAMVRNATHFWLYNATTRKIEVYQSNGTRVATQDIGPMPFGLWEGLAVTPTKLFILDNHSNKIITFQFDADDEDDTDTLAFFIIAKQLLGL